MNIQGVLYAYAFNMNIQGVSEGRLSILGGDVIGHGEK